MDRQTDKKDFIECCPLTSSVQKQVYEVVPVLKMYTKFLIFDLKMGVLSTKINRYEYYILN